MELKKETLHEKDIRPSRSGECLICDDPNEETSILLKNLLKRFATKKENAEE